MSEGILSHYLSSIQSSTPTIPAIIDPTSARILVEELSGETISRLEDIREKNITNITLFTLPDGKKHFPIDQVRALQQSLSLTPYRGKHIFLLSDIDTAQKSTQNALLKALEDCPTYAVILLVAQSATSLLDTIRSRTITLHHQRTDHSSPEYSHLLESYIAGNPAEWITYLYQHEFSKEEAILLLFWIYGRIDTQKRKHCKRLIEALFRTHESPRNILESFFLSP